MYILGIFFSPALVRAIGVKDEIVAATHVLSDMRVSFEVKGKNRIERLEIGVTSTRVVSAFAIDNIVIDRPPAGI